MKGRRGFSLVEIMVAMIILAMVAAGFFSVVASGRFLNSRSVHRLAAYEIARQELERRRAFVRADLWNVGGAGNPLDPTGAWDAWQGAGTSQNITYQRRVRVDSGAAAGLEGRFVTVQVRWNEPKI